jgi:hypothetical protein
MSKRIASKAKAKRALRKGHHSGYKLGTASKNKGNVKKGAWAENESREPCRWGYRIPGNAYSYKTNGEYSNKEDAKNAIKHAWKIKRLPKGFELWKD